MSVWRFVAAIVMGLAMVLIGVALATTTCRQRGRAGRR